MTPQQLLNKLLNDTRRCLEYNVVGAESFYIPSGVYQGAYLGDLTNWGVIGQRRGKYNKLATKNCVKMGFASTQQQAPVFVQTDLHTVEVFRCDINTNTNAHANAYPNCYANGFLRFRHIQGYNLSNVGGLLNPNVMVTTQLSGCSFCYLQLPNQLVVAHVQPCGNIPNTNEQNAPGRLRAGTPRTGANLREDLRDIGRFVGHMVHPMQVFGSDPNGGEYNHMQESVNIIGLRKNNRWHLYAQKFNVTNYNILGVVRFHP